MREHWGKNIRPGSSKINLLYYLEALGSSLWIVSSGPGGGDLLGPSTGHAGVEGPVLSRVISAETVLAQLEGLSPVLAAESEVMGSSSLRLTTGLLVFP